jgi:serine/threonine protein kinase
VYVVEDDDLHMDVVLKLIPLNNENEKIKEEIKEEIKVFKEAAEKSKCLVQYLEVFDWDNFHCVKMEYFSQDHIESQLNKKKTFTEEVCAIVLNCH